MNTLYKQTLEIENIACLLNLLGRRDLNIEQN